MADVLDRFLGDLRTHLRGLPEAEIDDIVRELRSHVLDSAGITPTESALASALERLGSPAELASQYAPDSLLTKASRSPAPGLLLRSVLRWAGVSLAGCLAFVGLLVGYGLAACFFVAAMAKPFAPGRVGLWRLAGGDELSLHLGLAGGAPPQGEDLLGWWIVPIGFLLAAGSIWFTARFGGWAIRRFRPARKRATADGAAVEP